MSSGQNSKSSGSDLATIEQWSRGRRRGLNPKVLCHPRGVLSAWRSPLRGPRFVVGWLDRELWQFTSHLLGPLLLLKIGALLTGSIACYRRSRSTLRALSCWTVQPQRRSYRCCRRAGQRCRGHRLCDEASCCSILGRGTSTGVLVQGPSPRCPCTG